MEQLEPDEIIARPHDTAFGGTEKRPPHAARAEPVRSLTARRIQSGDSLRVAVLYIQENNE